MKAKKLTFLIGIFFINLAGLFACSCERIYFCEYIQKEATKVAVKAKVIAHKEYDQGNLAVYLEIMHKYKDEAGLTDTIKLYGVEDYGGCTIDVHRNFHIGDTTILAIGFNLGGMYFVNPDSLSENHWGYFPNLCALINLRVENEKVYGSLGNELFQYPLSLFDEQLDGCRFSVEQLEDLRCIEENFIVYPNPSSGDKLNIRGEYRRNTFQKIRIFAADGRLLREFNDLKGESHYNVELQGFSDGLNIIEITCNGQVFYKKVIIEK